MDVYHAIGPKVHLTRKTVMTSSGAEGGASGHGTSECTRNDECICAN